MKILVVDDDADILNLMCDMLAVEHAPTGVTGGLAALTELEREPFDLMITDVRMPGMNGFSLIEEVKRRHPGLPVVVVSAYYDIRDAASRTIVQQYAQTALSKPLNVQAITRAVASAMAGVAKA